MEIDCQDFIWCRLASGRARRGGEVLKLLDVGHNLQLQAQHRLMNGLLLAEPCMIGQDRAHCRAADYTACTAKRCEPQMNTQQLILEAWLGVSATGISVVQVF